MSFTLTIRRAVDTFGYSVRVKLIKIVLDLTRFRLYIYAPFIGAHIAHTYVHIYMVVNAIDFYSSVHAD